MNATTENLTELLSLEATLEARLTELYRQLHEVRQQIKETKAEASDNEELPF